MNYYDCPACGEILANKVLIYEQKLHALCVELAIDEDLVSRGFVTDNEEFNTQRSQLVNSLCRRYCCKTTLLSYINTVQYITREDPSRGTN